MVRNSGKKSGAKWREEKCDTWQSFTIPIIRYAASKSTMGQYTIVNNYVFKAPMVV